MQHLLSRLLEPKTNGAEITHLLAGLLDVKIAESTIKKELEDHPDYPSLLSISDILSNYGVENLSVSFELEKLVNAPVPFITQIKGKKHTIDFFTVVKEISNDWIHFFDPESHQWGVSSIGDFSIRCSGIVLLTEVTDGAGEKEYIKTISKEKREHAIQNLSILWLPSIVLIIGFISFTQVGTVAILPFFFLLLTLAGAIVAVLLLWYELDQYNPLLQQLCGAGKKVSCNAVLQSKGSKIAGISWSAIGFSYFSGSLIIQIFGQSATQQTLFVVAWFSLLAIPYVFYSVYYQWQIAKQWCVLCLFIQGLLVLQFTTTTWAGWHSLLSFSMITPQLFLQVVTAFTIPFMVLAIIFPALHKGKEKDRIHTELQKLKHNPQIFEALLAKQKEVTHSSDGLGLTMGNPDAAYKIIKVCNPYCGPCAKAHVPMEALLHNNTDLQIQIIFTDAHNDDRNKPVKHLLAIKETSDEATTKKALDDWYLPANKDYSVFAAKYPMNGELEKQGNHIKAMNEWCKQTGIFFTPTFFVSIPSVDGSPTKFYQLPEIYKVADLKYFLSV